VLGRPGAPRFDLLERRSAVLGEEAAEMRARALAQQRDVQDLDAARPPYGLERLSERRRALGMARAPVPGERKERVGGPRPRHVAADVPDRVQSAQQRAVDRLANDPRETDGLDHVERLERRWR
jgi:hypothetical protein